MTTRPARMGLYRPATRSPRKSSRRATVARRHERAVKFAAQGRPARKV